MIRIQEYPQNPPSTELTVPYETEENGKIPYVALQYDLSLSFIKTLRFSEGIQGIDLSKLPRINAPNLQEICLPSTLTALIGFPYEEDSSLWLTTPMMMTSTFPSGDFPELQAIHVASDNPIFQSEDGILYQNEHLVCIPQNYQSESGTVTVREGTLDLHIGAVNDCRHIRRLVIPDSVIDLQVDAITATAEHPLTVVCSKGSVAAEYVAQFGTQYHLTVEYTD